MELLVLMPLLCPLECWSVESSGFGFDSKPPCRIAHFDYEEGCLACWKTPLPVMRSEKFLFTHSNPRRVRISPLVGKRWTSQWPIFEVSNTSDLKLLITKEASRSPCRMTYEVKFHVTFGMYQLVRIPPLTSAAVSTFRIAQVVRLRLYSVHVIHASEVVEGRPVSDFLHGSCCFTELRGGLGSIFCCGTGDQLESKTLGRVRWVVPNSTGKATGPQEVLDVRLHAASSSFYASNPTGSVTGAIQERPSMQPRPTRCLSRA